MAKEIKTIRKIVINECANFISDYNRYKNYCIYRDAVCKYFNSDRLLRCGYLEKAILPAEEHKAIYAMYTTVLNAQGMGEKVKDSEVKGIIRRVSESILKECGRCHEKFKPKSNRQIYCEKCKEKNQREQARLRKQNQRKSDSV